VLSRAGNAASRAPPAQAIGMDVHKESIAIAVRNGAGKIVMECGIETKASMILSVSSRSVPSLGLILVVVSGSGDTRVGA